MTDALPPAGPVRLGGTAYRLPGRYGAVFLMPPDARTYVAADAAARVYREYDLATGVAVRTLVGPDRYGTVSRPSADGTRIAVEASGGPLVIELPAGRVVFAHPPGVEAARFELAPSGDRLAVMVRHPDTGERESDGDMEDVYVRSVAVHDLGPGGRREVRPLVNFAVTGCFSPDGRLLATAGEWHEEFDDQPPPSDGPPPIQVWDAATGAELARIRPSDGDYDVFAAAAGGGFLLLQSARTGMPVALHEFATGRLIRRYTINDPAGYEAGRYALSPDGRVLAGLSWGGRVVRRDARTGDLIDTTPYPFRAWAPSYTGDLTVHAGGTVTALRADNQTVRAWSAPGGRPLARVEGGSSAIAAVGFADGGREVRTAGQMEAVVHRWEAETGGLRGEIALPEAVAGRTLRVWFAPAGWLVGWTGSGAAACHLGTGEVREAAPVPSESYQGVSLSADGWLVSLPTHSSGESDTGVRVEHVLDGGRREVYRFDGLAATAAYDRGRVLLTYDDRRRERRRLTALRVGAAGPAEVVWSNELPVGPEYRRTYGTGIDYTRVNFSASEPAVVWAPDGATALVVPRWERVPFLVDAATGAVLGRWASPAGWPHAAHPSRPVLATATADGDSLILADWQTGGQLAVVGERCYPHVLAWSPDGTRLAVALPDGTAVVFRPFAATT